MDTQTGTEETLDAENRWPDLALPPWKETRDTLHMWTQMAGKVQLAYACPLNHWWHVTLHVDARGLTTPILPLGDRSFQLRFDFLDHTFSVVLSDGRSAELELRPRSVARFYREFLDLLAGVGIDARLWPVPVEVPNPIPFEQDDRHAAYDPEAAQRFWRVLLQANRVLETFRSGFVGKCSPVHFFWGGFDLAVTRFSGRRAPPHPPVPGAPDPVVQQAYSHEVVSVGFWPGDDHHPSPAFYAYAYPEPPGFSSAELAPSSAHYDPTLAEFILPYESVRIAPDPDAAIRAFVDGAYRAAADLSGWDRQALEAPAPLSEPPDQRRRRS